MTSSRHQRKLTCSAASSSLTGNISLSTQNEAVSRPRELQTTRPVMASLLRQIVAGPRSRHPEAGLDLCYVTDFIIATYVYGSGYTNLPLSAYSVA